MQLLRNRVTQTTKVLSLCLVIILFANQISAQKINAKSMIRCVGELSTNIEALTLLDNFEFYSFDSTNKMYTYKHSDINVGREEGNRWCYIWKSNDTAIIISISTTDKNEYFTWIKQLKELKFIPQKPQYTKDTKEEWYYTKIFGVKISTVPTETTDKKMKINVFTFTVAKIPKTNTTTKQ